MRGARYLRSLIGGLICAGAISAQAAALEQVRILDPQSISVAARLDDRARDSTLLAAMIKYFERDGVVWVRFTVDDGGVLRGHRATLERPMLGELRIPQSDGGIEHRPRVALKLCLGTHTFTTEVLLRERSAATAYLQPMTLASNAVPTVVSEVRRELSHPNCTSCC